MVALLALPLCPASADTALPSLIRESRASPIHVSLQSEFVRHVGNGSIEWGHPFHYPGAHGEGDGLQSRETAMRRLGCMIALLMLPLCPASADIALPGLVRESLMVPITLADGS